PQATSGSGLPANTQFTGGDAGQHLFSSGVTLKTAGAQTVSVNDTVTVTTAGTSPTITVSAAAINKLAVVPSTFAVTAGNALDLRVTAQDAFGNTITNYGGTVSFTSSDTKATSGSGLPTSYHFVQGDKVIRRRQDQKSTS